MLVTPQKRKNDYINLKTIGYKVKHDHEAANPKIFPYSHNSELANNLHF